MTNLAVGKARSLPTFELLDETFELLDETFELLDETFELLDETFELLDETFELLDETFELLDETFELLDETFELLDETFELLDETFEGQCIKIAIFRVNFNENVKISLTVTCIIFQLAGNHQPHFKAMWLDGAPVKSSPNS